MPVVLVDGPMPASGKYFSQRALENTALAAAEAAVPPLVSCEDAVTLRCMCIGVSATPTYGPTVAGPTDRTPTPTWAPQPLTRLRLRSRGARLDRFAQRNAKPPPRLRNSKPSDPQVWTKLVD